jgi:hypothetical protein
MRSVFAILPIWAEPEDVVCAYPLPFHVSVSTVWSKWTETLLVVGADASLLIFVDVQIQTIVGILRTHAISLPVRAFGHLPDVIFMQVFANVTLLTEASKPVLAY